MVWILGSRVAMLWGLTVVVQCTVGGAIPRDILIIIVDCNSHDFPLSADVPR
jgi:hypothetical protein